MKSTPSSLSLPGLLCPVVVAPDKVLSMGQIELNRVLTLNWIVWNKTVDMNKNGVGIINLQWLMCHKAKPNQTKSLREPFCIVQCRILWYYVNSHFGIHYSVFHIVRDWRKHYKELVKITSERRIIKVSSRNRFELIRRLQEKNTYNISNKWNI